MPHPSSTGSTGHLRLPPGLRRAPIDPFEQIAQLSRRDRHRFAQCRRPDELALLQALGEQAHALTIVPEELGQIAADAAINQSMVIRHFGSKESLFAAVAELDFKTADLASVPRKRLGEALVRRVLDLWDDPKEGATLAAMMRASISNETARERVVTQFSSQVDGLFAAIGKCVMPAAPLIATHILGLTMARYIWRVPVVAALPKDLVITKVGRTVQRYLDDAANAR
jgi:AcrR family transcriptional regulator